MCAIFAPPFLAGFNPFHSTLFNFASISDCESFANAGCVLNKLLADKVNKSNFFFMISPSFKRLFFCYLHKFDIIPLHYTSPL